MKQVTAVAQTVEAAIEQALQQLNTTRDRIEVDVLDEGKKGLFGLFGNRPAQVRVTKKPDAVEEAKQYLLDVLAKLGVQANITVQSDGRNVQFEVTSEQIALMIGKRGQTLNALQYLTQLVANRYAENYLHIVINPEHYREKRQETLAHLADKMANKAIKTGRPVELEPMPSYERKVIHAALASNHKVETRSEGEEPYRRLVIVPKRAARPQRQKRAE